MLFFIESSGILEPSLRLIHAQNLHFFPFGFSVQRLSKWMWARFIGRRYFCLTCSFRIIMVSILGYPTFFLSIFLDYRCVANLGKSLLLTKVVVVFLYSFCGLGDFDHSSPPPTVCSVFQLDVSYFRVFLCLRLFFILKSY